MKNVKYDKIKEKEFDELFNVDIFNEDLQSELYESTFTDDISKQQEQQEIRKDKLEKLNDIKSFTIKEYFEGSEGQLMMLGKEATKLYKIEFNEAPPQVDDRKYGLVNFYPENILLKLTKPEKKKVTDIYCKPIIAKDLTHGWECKYRPFDEYVTKLKGEVFGNLIENIQYIKESWGGSYTFKIKSGDTTLHFKLNDGVKTRTLISSLLKAKINLNDCINIKIFSKNGWGEIVTSVNGKVYKGLKLDTESIIEMIGGAK